MMRIKISKILGVFILSGILVSAVCSEMEAIESLNLSDHYSLQNKIIIKINKENIVEEPDLSMGDIADIQADDFLKETIADIELGRSPEPGTINILEKDRIAYALNQQPYLNKEFKFICPEQVYVKRPDQEINREQIIKIITRELSKEFKGKKFELTSLNSRGAGNYPTGRLELVPDYERLVNDRGKLSCYLDVIMDEIRLDRISVTGKVAAYENVFFAADEMKKGDMVSSENVNRAEKNIFELRGDPVKDFSRIDGKKVKSNIRKGQYLTSRMFEEPHLIQKGDVVRLVIKNKNLMITAAGISMENGFKNDLIRVENISSGRFVKGIVKGKSKVEVMF